ncbi:glycerol acyltransferase [Saccharicrinis sp. FJH2]|uniref:glycerol acyltransferase n=1 Tax=Saccharicrinis sp. FJH65 TaxID=3344659 RepID=UPI0035F237AD
MNIEPLEIDIKKVFEDKSPGLARKIPGFIINYLKRIIHQDEINVFLAQHGHKTGKDFTEAILGLLSLKVNVKGINEIPLHARYTFASNHPLGGLDGIALLDQIKGKFGDVKILANDILMNIKNLDPFFIPVNKHGGQNKDFLAAMNDTYASDSQIAVFPAGLVSRRSRGIIRDLEWKKSFITKTVKYERDVVPVHVSGRISNFFYNLANFRKLLSVKTNIEMLYLPNEMFKFKNKEITITFGKPISYKTFTKNKKPAEWAADVKEKVYELAKQE